MKSFQDFVKNRPDYTLKRDDDICPYCDGTNIKRGGHSMTMVGGNPDPNHHTIGINCLDCDKDSIKEYKHANVWYSNTDNKLLRGTPSCFESWTYTCKRCDGDVKSQNKDEIEVLYPDGTSSQRNIWKCEGCGDVSETKTRAFGGEWREATINTSQVLWEKRTDPETYGKETYETKEVKTFIFKMGNQSLYRSDKNNEWEERIGFFCDSYVKTEKFELRDGEWEQSLRLGWIVNEIPADPIYNVAGVTKEVLVTMPTKSDIE